MAEQASAFLRRCAKATAMIGASCIAAADVWLSWPSTLDVWFLAMLMVGWQWAPIGLASACAYASHNRLGQLLFLSLASGFILLAGSVHVDVIRSTSSTAAVALVFYPIAEFAAWVVVIVIAALFGWRARDSWLKD